MYQEMYQEMFHMILQINRKRDYCGTLFPGTTSPNLYYNNY